jgi:hypothetical protein
MREIDGADRSICRCSFTGYPATTTTPFQDGWALMANTPGLPDGYYCKAHAAALMSKTLFDNAGKDGKGPTP